MGLKKNSPKVKQDTVKLLSEGNATLKIVKKLNRYYRTTKKEIENKRKTLFHNVTEEDYKKKKWKELKIKIKSKKSRLTNKKYLKCVANVNRLRTLIKVSKEIELLPLNKNLKEKV